MGQLFGYRSREPPKGVCGSFSPGKMLKFGFHLAASWFISERSHNSVNNNEVDYFLKIGAEIQSGRKNSKGRED